MLGGGQENDGMRCPDTVSTFAEDTFAGKASVAAEALCDDSSSVTT